MSKTANALFVQTRTNYLTVSRYALQGFYNLTENLTGQQQHVCKHQFVTRTIFTLCMLHSASHSTNCCQSGEIYKSAVTVNTHAVM